MASRLLLTLLALLTGLATQGSPARAGDCASPAQVVAAAVSPVTTRNSSVPVELQTAPRRQLLGFDVDRTAPHDGERSALVTSVLPGIDRAHE